MYTYSEWTVHSNGAEPGDMVLRLNTSLTDQMWTIKTGSIGWANALTVNESGWHFHMQTARGAICIIELAKKER